MLLNLVVYPQCTWLFIVAILPLKVFVSGLVHHPAIQKF